MLNNIRPTMRKKIRRRVITTEARTHNVQIFYDVVNETRDAEFSEYVCR